MKRLVPNIAGYVNYYKQCLTTGGYKLDDPIYKEIPESKLYVEDNMSTHWHRHVQQHGPGPEAYARFNATMILFEESLCSK